MKHLFPLIAAVAVLFSAGCAARDNTRPAQADDDTMEENAASPSGWYYFSDSGIHPAQNPAEIPARTFVPWTEAVRVSDTAIIDGIPAFLINRLGLMTTGSGDAPPALHTDAALLSSATAAGIYRPGTETEVRLYRNSFFTGSDKTAAGADENGSACLARFDPATGTFSVSLTAADFGLPRDAQCVTLDRIGSMWYAAFKYEQNSKVQFSYLEFESFPVRKAAGESADFTGTAKISADAYRKSVTPFPWRDAPESVVSVLSGVPATTGFNLRVYTPLSRSTETYIRSGEGTPVDGTAFVSDDKTAVLFADGTFYLGNGDTSGKVQVLQLPTLSNGYVYTSFVLSGKKLLVSWEEQRFFETGRAGLLEIALPDAIY